MPRFFIGSHQVSNGTASILGADAAHLSRALRVQRGELVVVVEAGQIEHGVRVDAVSPTRVAGRIAWSRPATGEPSRAITVLQAVPAREMDAAVEALVEAGAATIMPVLTRRSVTRPSTERARSRLERWRTIARESAQLAGRARAPEVCAVQTLPEALSSLPHNAQVLACVVDQQSAPLARVTTEPSRPVAVAIGPEGGFDPAEREALRDTGAEECHLGPRVFPAWLAGAVAVTLLLCDSGDLDAAVAAAPAS